MSEDNQNPPEFGAPASELAPVPTAVSSATVPQFATAEYAHIPGTEKCRVCGRSLSGEYYRVNGQMACDVCARQATEGQPTDSHTAFARGLLLGIGAALVGLAAYATVVIVTGWTIGYLALGVGWLVAKAMMKGSGGIGGRRYQVTAVLLTYAAISMAAIPIGISFAMSHHHTKASQSSQSSSGNSADGSQATSGDSANDSSSTTDSSGQNTTRPRAKIGIGAMIGGLLWLGLASPFLELQSPAHGLIGLLILFIGLRIAWQMTRATALAVDGPYSVSSP
jgi:hypothetical protein